MPRRSKKDLAEAMLSMIDQIAEEIGFEGRVMVCPGKKPGVKGARCYPRQYPSYLKRGLITKMAGKRAEKGVKKIMYAKIKERKKVKPSASQLEVRERFKVAAAYCKANWKSDGYSAYNKCVGALLRDVNKYEKAKKFVEKQEEYMWI